MANVFQDLEVNLRDNNPYQLGEVFMFTEGDTMLDRKELVYQKSVRDRYFTVVEGDTLWSISHQAYDDSKYWWIIRDINNLDEGLELSNGMTLIIPDLDTLKVNNL